MGIVRFGVSPDKPDLRAPTRAGRVTAHRKLAADRPACLAMGSSLDRVWPVPLVMVVSTSSMSTRGARWIMLAMSIGYVTCTHTVHFWCLC